MGIVAALMAAAAGFVSFEFFRSRLCSTLATGGAGLAVLLMQPRDSTAVTAAMLLLFGIGLAVRARPMAVAAAIAGMSISISAPVWQYVAAGIASVLLARCFSLGATCWSIRTRRFSVWIASAFCVTWSGAITERASQAVAPYQYEAAARACRWIKSPSNGANLFGYQEGSQRIYGPGDFVIDLLFCKPTNMTSQFC